MGILRGKLLLNNQFLVSIDETLYSFSRVTNLSDTVEYEPYQEGGYNDYPQLLRKPKTRMETVILERGILYGSLVSALTKQKKLTAGMPVKSVVIMVMNRGRVVRHYYFEHGIITRWEMGELDAMGNEPLIRKVEIAHEGLHEGDSGDLIKRML